MRVFEIEVDPADFGCRVARVVSICVSEGQHVTRGETLIEFECDKASFEVSMPADGAIKNLKLSIGDSISEKTVIGLFESSVIPATLVSNPSGLLEELIQRYPVAKKGNSLKEAIEILEASIRISLVSDSDAKGMAKIYEESSASYSNLLRPMPVLDELTQWYEDSIRSETKTFWKCELEDGLGGTELIGHCNVERVSRTPREDCHFIGLYVAAPSLPWTCGRMLAQHAIEYCQEQSVVRLFVFTRPGNGSAIKLLRSFGFIETLTEAQGGSDPICFQKKL